MSGSNSKRDPMQMLMDAFKLQASGAKSSVQGVQLGAAAILVRHATMIESGSLTTAGVPSLDKLSAADKSEARKIYVSDLIAKTCVVAPSRKASDYNVATFNVLMKEHARQRAAVMSSFEFAISLSKAGITINMFNDANRMFRVPANTLLEPDDMPVEATIKPNKQGNYPLVTLDGSRHGVLRGKQLATVAASVAQINKVAYMVANDGKKPVKGASKSAAHNDSDKAATPSTTADDSKPSRSLTAMVKQMADLSFEIAELMGDKTIPVIAFSELPSEMIAAFTECQIALDNWNAYLTASKNVNQKKAA